MIGRLAHAPNPPAAAAEALSAALDAFDRDRPIVVLCHFDADSLSAAAILVRALRRSKWTAIPLVLGKGETPWDEAVASRIRDHRPGGLILVDLGTRPEPVADGLPTLVIDHHVPIGEPVGAITISGNGLRPEPTTALLAWWAVGALGDQDDLLWLAAAGLIGDMADGADVPELVEAQRRWGKTALRDAVSLVNAPRRTAAADAAPALRLLLGASGPKEITRGQGPGCPRLARREGRGARRHGGGEARAAGRGGRRRAGPARLGLPDPPLDRAAMARAAPGQDRDRGQQGVPTRLDPLRRPFGHGPRPHRLPGEHRPPNADGRYGNGHAQATGGALRAADWDSFATKLGLPRSRVSE